MTQESLELDWARQLVSGAATDDPEYADALDALCTAVEDGVVSLAGCVAEALAVEGPFHNAERAYIYYYVAHSEDGFLVAWANETEEPDHYVGPVGDFRNESMVSDLVRELGVARLRALDEKAKSILRAGV